MQLGKKIIIGLWIFLIVAIAGAIFIFSLIANGKIGYMPPIEELQNPKNKFATEIYSADHELLGRYFNSTENRVNVEYNEISPYVINALIATEDVRFEDHSGIDFWALGRAIVLRGILQQKNAGGGSTITQQLAKQLWSPQTDNIVERALQKPIEWTIAVQLERYYSKQEILCMYLNQFDFLYNAVGIKSAAATYFNCSPADLKIEEAATLIGMCKNPSYFNPIRRNERTMGRRNVVLDQMRKAGYITTKECDSLQQIPLTCTFKAINHKNGLAPYFRENLRIMLTAKKPNRKNYASWQDREYSYDSLQWETNPLYGFCEKNEKADGSKYNIYNDGLKIYTTIDSRMQRYAEEAVKEHMSDLQKQFFREAKRKKNAPYTRHLSAEQVKASLTATMKQSDRYYHLKKAGVSQEEIEKIFNTPVQMHVFAYNEKGYIDTIMTPMDSIRYNKHFLRCGFMSMEPNGHVKAYVGGPNFEYFQYDMAGKGRRQVGSTVKPFLYSLAMESGYQPCDQVTNQSVTLISNEATGETWTPRNSSKTRIGEQVTLRWGLQTSNNWISAYLMSQLSPFALVNLMKSFGITGHIDPVVSLCLGPCEISVQEMVDAYTAFTNKGLRPEPLFVTRIEDNNGNVIAEFTPKYNEVLSELGTYKMIHMLRAVVNGGTGARLRFRYNFTADICGKTGTTQNNSDGWFMGFTPELINGVWVGGEERAIHFDNMTHGQGASMALPIWALYMQKVYADKTLSYSQATRFDIPIDMSQIEGCPVVDGEATPDDEVDESVFFD